MSHIYFQILHKYVQSSYLCYWKTSKIFDERGGRGEGTCRKWDGKGLDRETRVEQGRDGELEGQYRCTHDGIVARLKVHARRTGLMTNPVLETVSKSIRVRWECADSKRKTCNYRHPGERDKGWMGMCPFEGEIGGGAYCATPLSETIEKIIFIYIYSGIFARFSDIQLTI